MNNKVAEITIRSDVMNIAQINTEKQKLKEATEILKRNHIKYSLAFCKKDKEFHYLLRIFNTDPQLLDLVELVISI